MQMAESEESLEANLLVALWKSFPLLSQTVGDSKQILDVILPSQ